MFDQRNERSYTMPAIDLINLASRASQAINENLPDDIRIQHDDYNAINADYLNPLTDMLQLVIANVVAHILDAGSEREVVIEDDELTIAITNTLKEWTA
jgi:hypothetical protein